MHINSRINYRYILQLFATRVQPKPQITKLFPVEGLIANYRQANNITNHLDKFLGKLRATYNLVFRQPGNTSNIEKLLAKDASDPDLRAVKLIWANQTKLDDYTNLKYPDNSFLDHVKSLSIPKDYESKANTSSLDKDSTVEIKSTIEANTGDNANLPNFDKEEESSSNKTETLNDDDWLNDIQILEQLELQDEEENKKKDVGIVTSKTTLQLPATVGRHMIEWLGSLFGFTYNIYAKLSGTVCNQKATQ